MFLFCRKTEAMTTLAKALTTKNKLKKEIAQLQKKLETHNSVIAGNPRPFDVLAIDNELNAKVRELSQLKASITKANQTVQEKIYLLAELRGLIAFYRKIEVKEGKQSEFYRDEMIIYEAFMNELTFDEKIKLLENEAETIQDELELFNHTTQL